MKARALLGIKISQANGHSWRGDDLPPSAPPQPRRLWRTGPCQFAGYSAAPGAGTGSKQGEKFLQGLLNFTEVNRDADFIGCWRRTVGGQGSATVVKSGQVLQPSKGPVDPLRDLPILQLRRSSGSRVVGSMLLRFLVRGNVPDRSYSWRCRIQCPSVHLSHFRCWAESRLRAN